MHLLWLYYTAIVKERTSALIYCVAIGIDKGAFEDYKKLQRLTIPDGVTVIGDRAFYNCSSLQQITIPDSVTSIGNNAFEDCDSLQQITIPDSVTSIGRDTFGGCSSLKEITIPSGVTSIGEWTFWSCTALTQITIPDSVTSIGEYAFEYCSSLQQITIPDSVTSIGSSAFFCTSLTAIYFYGNAPEHNGDGYPSFPIRDSLTLYVLKDKSGWTVPTWEKWHTAYFTPGDENRPASTPTPVPTATPTPVPTQEATIKPNMGWPLVNAANTFSNGKGGRRKVGDKISMDDVFGTGHRELIYACASMMSQKIGWDGSCFGLSLLACADENGQISIRDYTKTDGISKTGTIAFQQITAHSHKSDTIPYNPVE